jgi:hypothetical protein
LRRLAGEVLAQFFDVTKFFIIESEFGANITESPCQLIMVRVTARQAIVIDKYPVTCACAESGCQGTANSKLRPEWRALPTDKSNGSAQEKLGP